MTVKDTSSPMRALILGGTAEARELATLLVNKGWHITTSLAGRVKHPRLPAGEVRIGGFGGPSGLARWILDEKVDVIVDATHPFAERISTSAYEAARATHVPLLALHRPAWEEQSGDRWIHVSTMREAALKAQRFAHVFLTIGRQQLAPFSDDPDNLYVIRSVERPSAPLPARHRIILDRGPFSLSSEKKTLIDNQIDVVITKNSGGSTYPKLEAARSLNIPVIIVDRPPLPASWVVTSADEAVEALSHL